MKYPLRGEYDTAVRNLDKFVFCSILKLGKPVKQTQNPHLLRSYNGGKAIVYEIQTNLKKYALKCWVEDLGDLKFRYKAIDEYLRKNKLPYFVDFSYNEQGILVNGQKFPIIRMEWIDGINFKKFISNNINNPKCIRDLAENFLEMVKSLHQNYISHGDLQHGNIIIRNNKDIYLIDYDSLYVPQLSNEKDNIKGLDGYQHPNRNKLIKLNPKSDYFSELVIYLSLIVISENPNYWKNIEGEETLLFNKKDLANPRSSPIFAELVKLSPEIVHFTLELEKFCRQSDIESLQPLEDLVNAYGGSKVSWDFIPNLNANSSASVPISVDLNNSAWNFPAPNSTKPNTNTAKQAKVSTSEPWDKLDKKSSNDWDFDKVQSPAKKKRERIYRPSSSGDTKKPVVVDESTWEKFDKIWNKFLKSISSAWDKFKNWLN